ncbi:cytochrome c-type biogenesis protein [Rheinheimera sp.]|uniref:cytochrome c-type biogenesis protein n=1 Tax=Rheinheimera sp. TaxID=1869214 RepID=UPI00307D4A4C
MKRSTLALTLASALLLLPAAVFAEEKPGTPVAITQFDSAEQQALFKELTHELRCPKCQNQNIADSHAVVAVDMRNKTLELLKAGQDKEQVLAYMKSRYGDFVHYQPPVNSSTLLLWIVPALMLVLLVLSVFWRRRGQHSGADSVVSKHTEVAGELDQLIEQYRRKP